MRGFSASKKILANLQPAGLDRTLSFVNDELLYLTGTDRQKITTDITFNKMPDWCGKKTTNSVVNSREASVMWC